MKRVVVLRALGLGDFLTAVPALRALADAFPLHDLVLAAPAPLAPLAELVGYRLADTAELEPLATDLHSPEVGVNLHGRGPQSHRLLLAAGPARVLWFASPEVPQSQGAPEWRPGEHEKARWCRMLSELGIAADPSRLRLPPPAGGPPAAARGATLIHPGAASAARRWPADRFAVVARAERESGRRVALTGSRDEVDLCLRVARLAGLPRDAVLAGRTDVAALSSAVTAADRVVCGDTGVAHLATAMGTPSVVLFGPTSPAAWGPPAGDRRHRALWAGQVGDPHALVPDPSLLRIEPGDVQVALAELG